MGRQFLLITALLIVISEPVFAQGHRGGRRGGFGGPNQLHAQPGPMHLSPEDRQAFRRNAERWVKMNPQQQQVMRERERMRQQQIRNEVDAAIRQSGLRLDQKGREDFEMRYRQERRQMERALREEFESKRQQELPQLNERLKKEFQGQQGKQSPAASPNR